MSDDVTRMVLGLRAPLRASITADGSRLVVTTARLSADDEDNVVELSVIDLTDSSESAVAGALPGDHGGVWAPDGRRLAWCGSDGEHSVVVVAEGADDPHPRRLSGTEGAQPPLAWSGDGRMIAFTASRGAAADRTRPYRWNRPLFTADGLGPLDDPPQLGVVDLAGGQVRWLSDDGWRWSAPSWSPAGDLLCATVSIDPGGQRPGQHVRILTLDGRITEAPVPDGRTAVAAWLPDGRLAVLVAEPDTEPLGSEAELFVVSDPGGDEARAERIASGGLFGDVYADNPAEAAELYDTVLLANARGQLVVRTGSRGRMGIAVIDTAAADGTTSRRVLADGARCWSPVTIGDEVVVVTEQSAADPVELVAISLADGNRRPLTSFASAYRPRPGIRRFTVTHDGNELDAWLLEPAATTAPPPAVLLIHGGPHYTYGESLHLDAHALGAAGFAVLYTNPRGSTGYGDAFAHAVHGDWADGPASDVLAVVDHAIAQGWIDGRRLGVTGNSYGGYLSALLASTTDRFAAAVIENPVTELVGMYTSSDIGQHFITQQMGGTPTEQPARYLTQSPLWQAARCTTPCLFVIGTDDRRCPPAQAWAMHRTLVAAGTPSEVLVLPDSPHEGSTYGPIAARLAHNEALVEWMSHWLIES